MALANNLYITLFLLTNLALSSHQQELAWSCDFDLDDAVAGCGITQTNSGNGAYWTYLTIFITLPMISAEMNGLPAGETVACTIPGDNIPPRGVLTFFYHAATYRDSGDGQTDYLSVTVCNGRTVTFHPDFELDVPFVGIIRNTSIHYECDDPAETEISFIAVRGTEYQPVIIDTIRVSELPPTTSPVPSTTLPVIRHSVATSILPMSSTTIPVPVTNTPFPQDTVEPPDEALSTIAVNVFSTSTNAEMLISTSSKVLTSSTEESVIIDPHFTETSSTTLAGHLTTTEEQVIEQQGKEKPVPVIVPVMSVMVALLLCGILILVIMYIRKRKQTSGSSGRDSDTNLYKNPLYDSNDAAQQPPDIVLSAMNADEARALEYAEIDGYQLITMGPAQVQTGEGDYQVLTENRSQKPSDSEYTSLSIKASPPYTVSQQDSDVYQEITVGPAGVQTGDRVYQVLTENPSPTPSFMLGNPHMCLSLKAPPQHTTSQQDKDVYQEVAVPAQDKTGEIVYQVLDENPSQTPSDNPYTCLSIKAAPQHPMSTQDKDAYQKIAVHSQVQSGDRHYQKLVGHPSKNAGDSVYTPLSLKDPSHNLPQTNNGHNELSQSGTSEHVPKIADDRTFFTLEQQFNDSTEQLGELYDANVTEYSEESGDILNESCSSHTYFTIEKQSKDSTKPYGLHEANLTEYSEESGDILNESCSSHTYFTIQNELKDYMEQKGLQETNASKDTEESGDVLKDSSSHAYFTLEKAPRETSSEHYDTLEPPPEESGSSLDVCGDNGDRLYFTLEKYQN